jgi:hypothetical protein
LIRASFNEYKKKGGHNQEEKKEAKEWGGNHPGASGVRKSLLLCSHNYAFISKGFLF